MGYSTNTSYLKLLLEMYNILCMLDRNLSSLVLFSFVSDIAVFIKGFTLYIMAQQGLRRRSNLENIFYYKKLQ